MSDISSVCTSGAKTVEKYEKVANINVVNISRNITFRGVNFYLWEANIKYWLFIPTLLWSMEQLYIHHLIT